MSIFEILQVKHNYTQPQRLICLKGYNKKIKGSSHAGYWQGKGTERILEKLFDSPVHCLAEVKKANITEMHQWGS